MSNRFKSSVFSGFDRKDVVAYVSGQAQEKESLIKANIALEDEIAVLKTELEDSKRKIDELELQVEAYRFSAEKAKEEMTDLQETVLTIISQLTDLCPPDNTSLSQADSDNTEETPEYLLDNPIGFTENEENEI